MGAVVATSWKRIGDYFWMEQEIALTLHQI
jgi:hypothetical protein